MPPQQILLNVIVLTNEKTMRNNNIQAKPMQILQKGLAIALILNNPFFSRQPPTAPQSSNPTASFSNYITFVSQLV
jgi:hypothetical protein